MKRFLILISLFAAANVFAQEAKTDAIFNAMEQEMKRTMTLSKTAPKIHFAAFKVTDAAQLSIIAARGGIAQQNEIQKIFTDVSLRVGNDKEDSSFFEAVTYNQSALQNGGLSPDSIRAGRPLRR